MIGTHSPAAGGLARVSRALVEFVEGRPALASTVLVVLLLSATIALLHPGYQSSDDAAMALYASGVAIRDTPDAHLLFVHAWIGWVLSGLYTVWPAVPWYALFLYAVLAFAHLVVLSSLRRRHGMAETILLFLVLFGVSLGVYAQELQFTIVAMYCTAAGWLAVSTHGLGEGRVDRGGWLVGLLALLVGASVRSISFVIATLLCAPFVLHGWAAASRTGRRQLAILTVAAGAGWALLHGLNAEYYRADPGWATFYEYNALRANFNDFQVIRYNARTRAAFETVGWSRNDFLMIKNWFYADPETFSAEKMRHVVALIGAYGTDVLSKQTWRRVWRAFATPYWLGAVIIVGWIGAVWGFRHVQPVVWTLVVAIALIAAVSVLFKPMPPRISITMAGVWALSASFLAAPRTRSATRPPWRSTVAVTMMLAVAGYTAWTVLRDVGRADARERHQHAFEADIRELAPRPSELFVAWGEAFPMKDIDPLAPQLGEMRILPLGAELGTPHVAGTLLRFGIDNLYLALVSRPDVFLISDEEKNDLYVDYMREKYGLDVTVQPSFEGRTFAVYTVESK